MSQPAVGIDLGTTYSVLATINPAGKPEIVPNKEGERVTASAVFFQENGLILIGEDAVAAAEAYPDRVVRWIKRMMGNAEWRFSIEGKEYSAVDLSAMILKKVRQDAEAVLGPIKHAVVTVPAYFDELRRKATMDAASRAGLNVLRIVNEPTAAAIAYAVAGRVQGKVLIYDFGGGTFDVSIANVISPTQVEVIASDGDHQLGGHDLDRLLASHLRDLFRERYKADLVTMADTGSENHLLAQAEDVKKRLSRVPSVPGVQLARGGHSMLAAVERAKFEDLIAEYVMRTEMLVENTLSSAGMSANDLSAVILVGGSTRIPAVKDMLRRKFGKEPVQHAINPDEAVALGAAIQAGILMQQKGLIEIPSAGGEALANTQLRDVTCHSYGTIHVDDIYGRHQLRNAIMIRKNTPIPCSRTESFYTIAADQRQAQCRVTQGEDEDPEFVKIIDEYSLELPPGRPAGREVRVTYAYDANGRMSCEFVDVESGRKRSFDFDFTSDRKTGAVPSVDEDSFDELIIE